MTETNPRRRAGRRPLLLAAAAVAIVAGLAAVYEMTAGSGNVGAASCEPAARAAERLQLLATGEVAAMAMADEARAVPDLAFEDGDGNPQRLSDWQGKTVLLNLWATWCAPCRHEMPALDALQAELGGEDFEVVAVSIDTGDPEAPREFLDEIGVEHLDYYADDTTEVFQELKRAGRAFGMPTTLLVDPAGCELGHLAGPAEWDSDDALALVRAAISER